LTAQLLPLAGAVTSTQLPDVEDSCAPPVADQLTAFVVPPMTVANMRRTLPGNTLKPKSGCVIVIAVGVDFAAAWIVSPTDAELVMLPEVPVTLTLYVPGTAALPAVKVKRLMLVGLAVGELNCAVTPEGTPATARLTLLLKAFIPVTPMVLLALGPPARRVKAFGEGERLKLDDRMVTAMLVVLVEVPEVPVTTTL